MILDPQAHWTFHQFFAHAEARGRDLIETAEGLRRNIGDERAAGSMVGLRRSWHYVTRSMAEERECTRAAMPYSDLCREFERSLLLDEDRRVVILSELARLKPLTEPYDGWREAPRDPILRPVPVSVWESLSSVSPDLTSHWQDDEEKPSSWTSVDWVAGSVGAQEMFFTDDGFFELSSI